MLDHYLGWCRMTIAFYQLPWPLFYSSLSLSIYISSSLFLLFTLCFIYFSISLSSLLFTIFALSYFLSLSLSSYLFSSLDLFPPLLLYFFSLSLSLCLRLSLASSLFSRNFLLSFYSGVIVEVERFHSNS